MNLIILKFDVNFLKFLNLSNFRCRITANFHLLQIQKCTKYIAFKAGIASLCRSIPDESKNSA
jgi:hypothetical protein